MEIKSEADIRKSAGGEQDYRKSINAAVRALWTGETDLFGFVDGMVGSIRRGLTRAWHEGAGSCGMLPADLTVDELLILEGIINSEISHVLDFGRDIAEGSRANKGKITPLLRRAQMWGNKYMATLFQAQTTSCANLKLRWDWNPLKEHCPSCRVLNGRVYRASTWRKYDLYPRHRRLACHGLKCGCSFSTTQQPCTPGIPPRI